MAKPLYETVFNCRPGQRRLSVQLKYTEFYRGGRPVGPAARLRAPAGATLCSRIGSGVTTLYKPFEIEGLLDVVRSILR
jgi:hypothetical protein